MPPAAMNTPDFRQKLDQCIHCGLCLPACPTYNLTQTEMESPRGRIALMRAASDGRIGLEGAFAQHLDLCLGCRACETACPSGVEYGALLEVARTAMAEEESANRTRRPGLLSPAKQLRRRLQHFGLVELMPHRSRLRAAARLLALYQRLGLPALAAALPLPPALRTMEGMLPPLRLTYPDERRPAPALGPRRGQVAFFAGCVQDAFLSPVNAATVRVLQRNGYEVHFPAGQSCCGAAALHTGELEVAKSLARRNIDAFDAGAFAAVVNNAGGCGATLLEYGQLLADDPAYAARARAFEAQVQDVTAFLAAHLHCPPKGHLQARVTYVDSCHLRNGQRVVAQPRVLLKAIPGLELVEAGRPDQCCGSAGIYNLLQPEMANQVLDAKLADVAATRAGIIAVANTGCYMQMVYGVKRSGLQATVMHVVELLDKAYDNVR